MNRLTNDLYAEVQTLRAQNQALMQELRNIANANPDTWDDPHDFTAWAQNRARFTIAKAQEVGHDQA